MHIPVLLHEAIEGLAFKDGDYVLDATLGDGGHAVEICSRIGKDGVLIGIDADGLAVKRATERLRECGSRCIFEKANFRNTDIVLEKHTISGIDKALFDLGVRSGTLEESGRGFSFRRNEPLLMTFDDEPKEGALTAYEILNTWDEKDIARIIYEYGEERSSRSIARAIIEFRKNKKIEYTGELVAIIEKSIPHRALHGRLHFATKTFQAIRMAVNQELESLSEGLEKTVRLLKPRGRIAVISFHSLEDRIVKNIFRDKAKTGMYALVTKKPIIPGFAERTENPRSRSAKLRIIEKQK